MSSIAALSTPLAPSALGVIRCSGPLAAALFPGLAPRRASLRPYLSLAGDQLDSVIATRYAAPASYTGEEMLELSCHGNPFILSEILRDLTARGFAPAEPGEFTRRAFLNGKLDLTQAEAVADLIAARSTRALAVAQRQLAGQLGSALRNFSEELLALIAQVEAYIDFPEEDLPPESPITARLTALREKLAALQRTHAAHTLTFRGARLALIGAPNAGKSSLFNALIGSARAIVSPIAGTTRDFIEAPLTLGGHSLQLIDTAGLNPTATDIEALGIELTREQLATADIILWVIDPTAPLPPAPAGLDPARTFIALNKSDLASAKNFSLPASHSALSAHAPFTLSATNGQGLDALRSAIAAHISAQLPAAESLLISARHAAALTDLLAQLDQSATLLTTRGSPELIAHHLHSALHHLGLILGRFDNERILDHLFAQFCIGK